MGTGWHEGTVEAEYRVSQPAMSMQQHQQPRQRQRQRQQAIASDALYVQLVQTLQGVQEEQKEQAGINEQTKVALTQIVERLKNVEKWQDSADERREKQEDRQETRYEQQPDKARNMLGTYGGCIGQAVFACFYIVSIAISITALIITLTH